MNVLGTVIAALLNSLWQSAVMALLVWAALRFLPRLNITINAATRCAVWWAVLAAVVLLPIAPQTAKQIEAASVASQVVPVRVEAAPEAPVQFVPSPAPSRSMGPLQITTGGGLLTIFAIWSALSLFRISQIIRSYGYLRGIKQRSRAVSPQQLVSFDYWLLACGVDRTARLLVSSEIASPMAVGFRRPVVIVPETLMNEFTGEELDHVILHELAHIARYDDWTNLFARLIGAMLPIHPVAVWLLRRIEQDREIACDDWVVAMTGEARPYAASLTRLFELCSARRRQLLATGMADRASHLGERIEALLRAGRDFAPRVSLLRVALGAAILLALVLACAQTPKWIAFAQEPRVAPAPPLPPAPPAPQLAPLPQRPPTPRVAKAPQLPQAPEPPIATQDALQQELAAREAELRVASEQLGEMQKKLAELNHTYTKSHPAMQDLAAEIRAQDAQVRARQSEMRNLELQMLAQETRTRAERANHNPNGSFLAALVAAGYGDLSVDEIIELRNHGISSDFLRAIGQVTPGKLSTKELIALAENGVRPDLFRALREVFPKITVREIIEAAQQGMKPDDLRQAKEFSPNLTLPQIIKLKQAGVI